MPMLSPDLRRALGYVRPYWRRLLPMVGLSVVSTGLSLAMPLLSKLLVDRALIGRDVRVLVLAMAGFLGLTLAGFVVNVVSGLQYTRVSVDILFDMRLALFRHLQQLSPRYYAQTPIGQIASRVNSDVGEIQRVAAEVALAWVGQVLFLVGSIVMLILLDVRLFLVGLIALPPALWALVRYRRRLETAVTTTRDQSAAVGTFLIEALQGMKLVVAHNAQSRSVDEFRRRNTDFVDAVMSMRRLTYLSGGLPGIVLALGSSTVFLYGGWRVISGDITMGTLVAFAAYQMRLLGPVQGLMGIYSSIASARVSLRRVAEIFETPIDITDPESPIEMASPARPMDMVDLVQPAISIRRVGRVTFEGVTFTFARGGPVLYGVTLDIAPGELVAIVGASGAGKSTIADLLVRYLDPERGRVLLDGHDLRALRLAKVRRHVLAVEQDPFVFHASLGDNLRVAAPGAGDAELQTAAEVGGLGEWLASAPKGLATVVGERGKALSSGERQRLALARAYLANPSVLVLDEATASLDPATEGRVIAGLDTWIRRRTAILITHRLDVARRADRVVVLEGGRIVEEGQADALMQRGGSFARLFGLMEPVG
ncbi:MAG: ABC transporter ATP-binding protein [Gemmatimonadaceae bacterium]|nr:ABC transporter ATP-binding protein [Gemmatimonadaceae bacterium]